MQCIILVEQSYLADTAVAYTTSNKLGLQEGMYWHLTASLTRESQLLNANRLESRLLVHHKYSFICSPSTLPDDVVTSALVFAPVHI